MKLTLCEISTLLKDKSMKLAVSSIAWTNDEEAEVAELLRSLGVTYVEVAPTKQWQDPTVASPEELSAYKKFWKDQGIDIVAFQSMLFNRPDLKIFDNDQLRNETLDYLSRFIGIAPKLGAGIMVFGSPKNRQRGNTDEVKARQLAKDFFAKLGDAAQQNHTCFCIEPNPEAYACDFITTAQQGTQFVKEVNNPGFGLHLDIAGMTLAGDDVAQSIKEAGSLLRHFHISAPYLEQVEDRKDVDYRAAAEALRAIDYQHFVSIEMKPAAPGQNVARTKKAVKFAQQIFGD
jgi:sugar phosphate isomerase/epimerase